MSLKENAITKYVKESRVELSKVIWPTRSETINSALLVIGVSIGVGLVLGLSDYLFTLALQWFLTLKQ